MPIRLGDRHDFCHLGHYIKALQPNEGRYEVLKAERGGVGGAAIVNFAAAHSPYKYYVHEVVRGAIKIRTCFKLLFR